MIFEIEGAFVVTRDNNASFTGLNPGEMFLHRCPYAGFEKDLEIHECKNFFRNTRIIQYKYKGYSEKFNSDDCFHILSIESTLEDAKKSSDYYLVTDKVM